MKTKSIMYFHPRERKSVLILFSLTVLFCLSENRLAKWLSPEPTFEILTMGVKENYLAGCYEANLLTRKELIGFGLDSALAGRWINYRNTIGGFEKMEQVRQVFRMPERLADQMEPILRFEEPLPESREEPTSDFQSGMHAVQVSAPTENTKEKPEAKTARTRAPIEPFCLNTADEETLRQIRGIGEVFASRIIRFRELLGGYHSVEQLKEVFGMEPDLVDRNAEKFLIDSSRVVKIDWQSAEFREVLSHPYMDYDDVVCIFQMRREGTTDATKLKKCFDAELWGKISPYLQ